MFLRTLHCTEGLGVRVGGYEIVGTSQTAIPPPIPWFTCVFKCTALSASLYISWHSSHHLMTLWPPMWPQKKTTHMENEEIYHWEKSMQYLGSMDFSSEYWIFHGRLESGFMGSYPWWTNSYPPYIGHPSIGKWLRMQMLRSDYTNPCAQIIQIFALVLLAFIQIYMHAMWAEDPSSHKLLFSNDQQSIADIIGQQMRWHLMFSPFLPQKKANTNKPRHKQNKMLRNK